MRRISRPASGSVSTAEFLMHGSIPMLIDHCPPILDVVRFENRLVGEQELPQAGVEGEAVDALAGAVDEHGRAAVDDVAGGPLLPKRAC